MAAPDCSPRRVLMTADTIGGVWTYAIELASALNAHGIEIALATMGAPLTDDQRATVRGLPNITLFESRYKLEWMDNPWDDIGRAGDWLLSIQQRFHPDLVHLNGYVHAQLNWQIPTIVVGHSCVLSWWQSVKKEHAPAQTNFYRDQVSQGIAHADLLVTPSLCMMKFLNGFYGPLPPTRVIANARNSLLFKPSEKKDYIFSAGRLWDEAKNTSALQKIASEIQWPVLLAGQSIHPSGTIHVPRNVTILNYLPQYQMAAWLASASIYALPARYEPFGLTVLEAALSNCAIVLGDIESLRENWSGAACFVHPEDPAELRSALQHLITNTRLRQHLASKAKLRTLNFAPQRMASEYLDAYEHVLSKNCRSLSADRSSACA
jgi:glycogen synthase